MAYEGEILNLCPANGFTLGYAFAVVVSGDPPNTWGHMLLNTGGPNGFYFQVAGIHKCPRFMNQSGYNRYLRETKKKELKRFRVFIPDTNAANRKLEELLSKPWAWWVVVHNCETFVEQVIIAGGGQPIHKGTFYKPVDSRQQGVMEWDAIGRPFSFDMG